VTLVAVGHLVQIALAVAGELAEQDISVEVFDPRIVYPFDWELLRSSVAKTGRLVIADDTNRTCGLAGEIIATIAEEMPLRSRPRIVTRADVAVPFAPVLEEAVIPGQDAIAAAIKTVMEKSSGGMKGVRVPKVGMVIARIREES
jgi:acetoin:2,6-dichlorophenolindophenol oxidoreductase subunit beta